jgi:hypothetical protein
VRLEGLGQLKKIHLIGTPTLDLPACSIVPQPTTLPRAPYCVEISLCNNETQPSLSTEKSDTATEASFVTSRNTACATRPHVDGESVKEK